MIPVVQNDICLDNFCKQNNKIYVAFHTYAKFIVVYIILY